MTLEAETEVKNPDEPNPTGTPPPKSPDMEPEFRRQSGALMAGTVLAASSAPMPGAGAALMVSSRRATRAARWIARTRRG